MSAFQFLTLLVFIISYAAIFSGRVNRTVAAALGAVTMVAIAITFGVCNEQEALLMIDFNVIGLLFGMMIITGTLAQSGFFSFLGIKVVQICRCNIWLVLISLSLITAFVSMIIDNVTTILLIIPVIAEISKNMKIEPTPLLLSVTVLSNIGGVATMIGDPPNIMIGSAAHLPFNAFIMYLMWPVLLIMALTVIIARPIYKRWLSESAKKAATSQIIKMNAEEKIRNPTQMTLTLLILSVTVLMFVLHERVGISVAFVALIGGSLALIFNYTRPERVLYRVEWTSLIFFAGLFIIVGIVDKAGLLRLAAKSVETSSQGNLLLISILILWMTALLTAFVDNIPVAAVMIPVITHLSAGASHLLWWALALGVGFGGNATPIGSSAGVVTISLSRRFGHTITLGAWLRFALPVTVISLAIATLYIYMLYALGI